MKKARLLDYAYLCNLIIDNKLTQKGIDLEKKHVFFIHRKGL